jgi:hypothetical protein
MADPVSEGAPEGRSDPGSGLGSKIGPLPLGLWILVGGGILVGVWWFRSHQSSSATSTDSGATLGGGSVPPPDVTTLAGLMQAMQNLATQNGANSISPAAPAPSAQGTPQGDPLSYITREVINTTHTSGGNDTGNVSTSGLPDITPQVLIPSPVNLGDILEGRNQVIAQGNAASTTTKIVTTAPATSWRAMIQRVLGIQGIPGGDVNPQITTTTYGTKTRAGGAL